MRENIKETPVERILFSKGVGCRFPRFSDLGIILGNTNAQNQKERHLTPYREECIKLVRFNLSGDNHG